MKREDITLIAVIIIVSGTISIFLSKAIVQSKYKHEKVQTVTAISGDLPDVKNDAKFSKIFNKNALDPTQTIQIGNQINIDPFRSAR